MQNKFKKFLKDPIFVILILVFIAGSYLRLTDIYNHAVFLGDQGRDAIIVAEIAKLQHFPAIGASTSIGGVFLGPFYYYFIAPWLIFSNFDPVGLAYGVAFFSSIFILIFFAAVSDLFNKKIALIATVLLTFSSVQIDFSRFSWNPNLLPLFSFLSIYFLIKAFISTKSKHSLFFFFLSGAFLSFSIQLHYLVVGMFIPVFIYMAVKFWFSKKRKLLLQGYFLFLFSFFIFISPLVIFDLRHDFINTKSLMKLLESDEVAPAPFAPSLLSVFQKLVTYATETVLSNTASLLLSLILVVIGFIQARKKNIIAVFFLFLFAPLPVLASFAHKMIPHYLGFLYAPYYIILAWIFSSISISRLGKILTVLFLITFIASAAQNYKFLKSSGDYQIKRAKRVAYAVERLVEDRSPYAMTSIPLPDRDNPVRYFLNHWGQGPIKREDKTEVDLLVVLCETKCKPIGDPQWDIANFAPKKIEKQRKADNMYIYLLTR